MAIPFNLDWLKEQQEAAAKKSKGNGKPEHTLPPYDVERLRKEQWERLFGPPGLPKSDKP